MLSKEQKNSPEIFSVSQLNKNAKFSLEKKFNDVWVPYYISLFSLSKIIFIPVAPDLLLISMNRVQLSHSFK